MGVVAAGHPHTARAAEEVLRAGGNAYDAAIAALTTACVAEPVLASLGGGGFLLAAPTAGAPRVYDFFVNTPRRRREPDDIDFYPLAANFGSVTQEFHIGRGTFAVPGLVRGLFDLHRDLGSVPMPELVAQAALLAREGVEITPFQAYLFEVVKPMFTATAGVRTIYGGARAEGALVGTGETLRNPDLADALEVLALEGDDLFYRGEIARAILAEVAEGGQVDERDLAEYRVVRRVPLSLDYHGVRVLTNPPPSSGGLLVAFGLRLLDELLPAAGDFGSFGHLAVLAAAMDLTGKARVDALAAGDAAHVDSAAMLDPEFLARYRGEVRNRAEALRGTTQISIIDGAGNLAALTVSNGEGCGHVAPGTGIVLNNMLGEEDLNPGGFQRWPAGQRMTSMMAPTGLAWRDGRIAATGSGGSNRIRTAVLQVVLNLVDYGMGVTEAVEAPRIHFERGLLSVEEGFPRVSLDALQTHFPQHQAWAERNMFFGGAHTVMRVGGAFEGAGDPRRGGVCRRTDR